MDPFRIRPWRLFFGIVGAFFLVTLFVALGTYDDDKVPSFAGQEALLWAVVISFAVLVAGALIRGAIAVWRVGARGPRARWTLAGGAALLAVLIAGALAARGIDSHRELPAAEAKPVTDAWLGLQSVCGERDALSRADAVAANDDLHAIFVQFRETPDAKLRFGADDEPRPMRELVRSLTDPNVIPAGMRCVAVSGWADLALRQEAGDELIDPPGPALQ